MTKNVCHGLVLAALLTGCSTFSSQVQVPTPVPYTKAGSAGNRQTVNTWAKAAEDIKGLSIPKTADISELRPQLRVYAAYWMDVQGNLLLERDVVARARDVAVVTAAVQAIQSLFKQARYSAIVAAGLSTYSDAYQVEVQSRNYRTAAKRMTCILQATDKVPADAWGYFNVNGEFTRADVSFPPSTAAENIAELNDIFPAINRTMNRVLYQLVDDQVNLKLSGINLETVRAAYDKEKAAIFKATNAANKATAQGSERLKFANQALADDNINARILVLKTLPAEVEKCLGAASG